MPLPPLTDLLDVRETREGRYPWGAAWLPVSQLRSRLSELPPSTQTFRIVDAGPDSEVAIAFLSGGGRRAELVKVEDWSIQEVPFRMWAPGEFLKSYLLGRPAGIAIDLGCGTGRDAVFLASLGWEVVAIDRLPEALDRGRELAARYGVGDRVKWICTHQGETISCSRADLVYSIFALSPAELAFLNHELRSDATLLVESFTETHREKVGKPKRDRILSEALVGQYLPDLRILSYEEGWRDSGRHTGRLIAAGGER